MKKKGFTLIELLAVIVIMGILMFAAIPAINRTIENARKDQFVNLAQNYARAVETLWQTDGLECKSGAGTSYQVASALPKINASYCVDIDTTDSDPAVQLLQQGGKSPWGNSDVVGKVYILYSDRRLTISPLLYDGTHSINSDSDWDYRQTDYLKEEIRYGDDALDIYEEFGSCNSNFICRAV